MDVRGAILCFNPTAILPGALKRPARQSPRKWTSSSIKTLSLARTPMSELLNDKNVPNALISSFIVTIPATIIPITIAAFAAYAFAWMQFPGAIGFFVVSSLSWWCQRNWLSCPFLQGFSGIASWATALNQWLTDCELNDTCQVASKSFAGLWVTHTAFGLPLAIYLLRNYIVGLPKELLQKVLASTEQAICKFSPKSSYHFRSLRWPLLAFFSSYGSGMI